MLAGMIIGIIIGMVLTLVAYSVGLSHGRESTDLIRQTWYSGKINALEEMLRMRNEQIRAGQKGIARLRKKIKKLQQPEGDTDEFTP